MSEVLLGHPSAWTGPTLDLFGCEEQTNQQVIIQHTLAVLQHLEGMQQNAMHLSLHLYLLRQEFNVLGDKTWGEFCRRNFEHLGLHDSGIRAAVRSGKAIAKLMERGHGNVKELSSLSRAALFAFSDAPAELQTRVFDQVIEMREAKGGAPTAAEVKSIVDELKQEISSKDDLLQHKDAALMRMNNLINAKENETSELREEVEKLHRKLSNQPQAVVHELPPGIRDAQQARDRLENELSQRRDELMRVENELTRAREEQQKAQQLATRRAQAQNALDNLEADLKSLSFKYTQALAEKIRSADRSNIQTLERLANGLRALADQLSPSLI